VNKSDLIARMTERFSGDRTTAAAAVNGVLAEIEGSVARGERVSLTGFGTFERRERAPRTARNPRTGETITVEASVVPVFRAGTGFRALLTEAEVPSTPPTPAVEVGVPKAKGKKSKTAADGGAGTKEQSKKARDRAAENGGRPAPKAGKGKKEKKAAKASR
jgi:DNA-binding protein HU-beta